MASPAYARLRSIWERGEAVILDGAMATELQRLGLETPEPHRHLNIWGTWALDSHPSKVTQIHRNYIEVGCDVITTNTWSVSHLAEAEEKGFIRGPRAGSWLELARAGLRCGREALEQTSKSGECALAFSIDGDVTTRRELERLKLLCRVFREDPPDMIFLETLGLIRDGFTLVAVEMMLETGLPVWLSFRRCREGVCGVFGQLWGGPEGDRFGRAAQKFEEMGVEALLFNCLPVWRLSGSIAWLRDFVDLPIGVYPNLGHSLGTRWQFSEGEPHEFAHLARAWRREGAQILGGCCGVSPEHIASMGQILAEETPSATPPKPPEKEVELEAWTDLQGRQLFPLPFPKIVCEPGVFRPTQGSFLVWKSLFTKGLGRDKDCLEVGCGTGVLAIQLALNGARSVEAVDIDLAAVHNTRVNAFRNGVEGIVSASQVDIYTYRPKRSFDLIVASLFQMPVDPRSAESSLRPADFWGRNALDHLISLLPELLEESGVAYLMQISVLSQQQTAEQLARNGLKARVVDFSFFYFSEVFYRHAEQIEKVTELSDAFNYSFGGHNLMVMYLLEVRLDPSEST